MPSSLTVVDRADLAPDRQALVDQILDDRDGPVLTVLTGPAGIGRTRTLAALSAAAEKQGRPVLSLRNAPLDRTIAYQFISRLAGEVSLLRGRARPNPTLSRNDAAALVRILRGHPGAVLVVDDGQWIDDQSLTVVERMIRGLTGSAVRCVCGVRISARVGTATAGRVTLNRLRALGLARLVALRPLSIRQVDAVLTRVVRARPHPVLRDEIARTSRGVPAALHAAIDGYQRSGSVRVVDGHAYLVDSACTPDVTDGHPLVASIRSLPVPAWTVAKAMAVLYPLGRAVPGLMSETLQLTEGAIETTLETLVHERVLRVDRRGGWTFVLPLTAVALRSCLGHFERRRLARVAVSALWSGTAHCADPHYLPEQLACAGSLVDSTRAVDELLAHGTTVALTDPRAARWLSAATALGGDRQRQATALLHHAITGCRHGDYREAMRSARTLLGAHRTELSTEGMADAEIVYLSALRGLRNFAALERVASGDEELPGRAAPAIATRAAALCLLGRWALAASLLAGSATSDRVASAHEELEDRLTAVMGEPKRLRHLVDVGWVGRPVDGETVAARVRMLAMLGDVRRAARLMGEHGFAPMDLPRPDQCLLAWRQGRWDVALDQARTSIATDVVVAHQPADGVLYRAVGEILLARGRPSRAKAMLDNARAERVMLPHLLDPTAADIACTLGSTADAERIVAAALDLAARNSIVYGTDELWLRYTELAHERDDGDAARRGVAETARVAEAMGTELSSLHHQLARVVAFRDRDAARAALRVARALDQPFTLARTLERVVRCGDARADLLHEAYELFRDLDALLYRSRIRGQMRANDVVIPDRAATVSEGDRLLAELVAEGLSNRELAAALQTSEKSVESRLTRLFTRRGYRSRVEIAAAMLTA